VVASKGRLYVGFDNRAAGVQIFRSRSLSLQVADFEGESGCQADAHPLFCLGLGGAGLGNPKNKRIFDATKITDNGRDYVYLTTGDGSAAVSVYRIVDWQHDLYQSTSRASICETTVVLDGDVALSKRATAFPWRSTKNLTKFQPIAPSTPVCDVSQA
jgi:hypothetical protein